RSTSPPCNKVPVDVALLICAGESITSVSRNSEVSVVGQGRNGSNGSRRQVPSSITSTRPSTVSTTRLSAVATPNGTPTTEKVPVSLSTALIGPESEIAAGSAAPRNSPVTTYSCPALS